MQIALIVEEVGERNYSMVFDGTPYRCECFGIGIRFIDDDGQVRNMPSALVSDLGRPIVDRSWARLVMSCIFSTSGRLLLVTFRWCNESMLANSMDAKDIVGEISDVVGKKFRLDEKRCRGIMLDGCSANMLALSSLLLLYRNAVGIRCFSHLLNNVGKQLDTEEWDKFAGSLHTLLSHSTNAKTLWKQIVGVPPPQPPSHRFGSTYERDNVIATNWPKVKDFVKGFVSKDETRSKTAKSMLTQLGGKQLDGVSNELSLKLSLAMAVDVGQHITTGTYVLEGDDFLVRMCVGVWIWDVGLDSCFICCCAAVLDICYTLHFCRLTLTLRPSCRYRRRTTSFRGCDWHLA